MNDLERTIEELAKDLQGIDYRAAEQRMRASWRLAWLRILEQAQRLVSRPQEAPRQLRSLFRSVSQELRQASLASREWLTEHLPLAWQAGMRQGDLQLRRQQHRPVGTSFSLVHREAVGAIAKDSMSDLLQASQLTEARVKSKVRKLVKDEVEGLVATGQRATGKRIAERLAEDQIFGITASNGRFIPMEEYGRIVAHVKLREAHTKGVEQLIQDNGLDLVQISKHVHKPDLCTPLEGKVYSLSGQDTRFPKLPRHTPFHIGCRHVETPFVARFYDEDELAQLAAQSASQKPVEVYTSDQLAKVEKKRKKRAAKRAEEREVEQQNEKAVAQKKIAAAKALKAEVVPMSVGGPRVNALPGWPESHAEVLAELAAGQKLRTAENVTRSLDFPNDRETTGSLFERMGGELALLPPTLLKFWSERLDYHLELVGQEPGSEFAAAFIPFEGRAFVEAATWLYAPGVVLEEATHLLDHGLGNEQKTFSAGGGVNQRVSELGQRWADLYEANPSALGEYGSRNSREYLAWAVRLFHSDQQGEFQRNHPELFEFIEQVWLNEEVWKEALGENLP